MHYGFHCVHIDSCSKWFQCLEYFAKKSDVRWEYMENGQEQER